MNTSTLLASFAVAATASAAELKNPVEVAREWKATAGQPLAPWSDNLSLRGEIPKPVPLAPPPTVFFSDSYRTSKGGARIEP